MLLVQVKNRKNIARVCHLKSAVFDPNKVS